MTRSKKWLPPAVSASPVVGGLIWFMKGPVVMLREEYPKLGSVFTLNLLNKKITFLIGPEVSAHLFKAPESDLSQQEVYQFNVLTFGPGVVFDVDYTIRQEQFRFFTEALRVNKLKGYVDQMVTEAEVNHRMTTTMQRRIYGHATDVELRPLNEEKAVQAAVDLIGEMFVFSVAVAALIFEVQRSSRLEAKKEGSI